MRKILVTLSLALVLLAGHGGTASAHTLTVDPVGNGQGVTDHLVGGGPAHCRAQAPAQESSPVVGFTPPGPICP